MFVFGCIKLLQNVAFIILPQSLAYTLIFYNSEKSVVQNEDWFYHHLFYNIGMRVRVPLS
ncbi:MAG: hypothetical protein COA85_00105 [Robiginitomaculum sp.]|nr:MAG: hypothetical protein COA85_00105 [Robiginitomaculum sp.]